MGNQKIKQLSEGAMMVALVGVALFINQQLAGLLEYAIYWILAFPILIYTVRYGVKQALIPAVSMILLSFFIAMPTTIFYLGSALVLGIVYGGGVRNKWPNGILLLVSGILTLISYGITMVVFAQVFGFDPQEDLLIAEKLLEMLHVEGLAIGQIALVFSLLLTVLTATLQTICVHLFTILMLRRMKIMQLQTKNLFDLAFPKAIGWISICIWVLFYLRNVIKLEGHLLIALISAYCVLCIIACAEVMMDIMCFSIVWQKRMLSFLAMFLILGMMAFTISRNLVILVGIWSCIMRPRVRWKAGVNHGTIRKS